MTTYAQRRTPTTSFLGRTGSCRYRASLRRGILTTTQNEIKGLFGDEAPRFNVRAYRVVQSVSLNYASHRFGFASLGLWQAQRSDHNSSTGSVIQFWCGKDSRLSSPEGYHIATCRSLHITYFYGSVWIKLSAGGVRVSDKANVVKLRHRLKGRQPPSQWYQHNNYVFISIHPS